MTFSRVLVIFILIIVIQYSSGKRVLFFPCGSTSHIRYHTNVARELAKLNHQVTVAIPEYLRDTGKINIDGIDVLYWGHTLGDLEERVVNSYRVHERFWKGDFTHSGLHYLITGLEIKQIIRQILSEPNFMESIKNVNADLFVLDSVLFVKNLLLLPYKFGIPFALLGTVHDVAGARVPFSPAALPMQSSNFGDEMNFFQRLETAIGYISLFVHDPFSDSNLVAEFAPERPFITMDELGTQAEIYLAEMDPVMDYPRPTLPNTKLIGGTAISSPKPLKEPYKSFADSSKETGLAVVTFGSTLVNIPEDYFQKMVDAFQQLQLKFVWRVNHTSPDPNHILTSMWLPQNDLLAHNNTKIFISHCGKNGQYEALYNAVPILCLPIFGDQPYNSARIVHKGFGLRSDIRYITSSEFADIIKEVAFTPKYKTSISKASQLFRELYNIPNQKAAFWFDHVMKYGGEYMRSAGQKMPLYKFLMLDVAAFLIAVAVLFISMLFVLLKYVYKICTKHSKLKEE